MRVFHLGPLDEAGSHSDSSSGPEIDWEEEDLDALKTRSLVCMEQNLMDPFDSAPISPLSLKMRESEMESTAQGMEKLLMERLMLRKELRLRSMQERLLQQEQKLDEKEARLREVEALPGFKIFETIARMVGELRKGMGGVARCLYQILMLVIYHAPLWLLNLVPPRLTIALANLTQQLGSVMAQRAENFSNECVESLDWQREKEMGRGQARRGRRRRRRSS